MDVNTLLQDEPVLYDDSKPRPLPPEQQAIQDRIDGAIAPQSDADLIGYEGGDRVVSSIELLELLKGIPAEPRSAYPQPSLNQKMEGFEAGEVIVVSGPTGHGKTTFCDTVTRALRREGKHSLFFTFEVQPRKFVEWHQSHDSVVFLPLSHKAMDLKWLRQRCIEARLKYNVSAVFIDHLHYVLDMGTSHNMSLEIGRVMRFLKQEIALRLGLAVFLVCHITKTEDGAEPSIRHLRDSSLVGQEADQVIMVWRNLDVDPLSPQTKLPTMDQCRATIKIEKARRSGVMNFRIPVIKRGRDLVEEETHEQEPLG